MLDVLLNEMKNHWILTQVVMFLRFALEGTLLGQSEAELIRGGLETRWGFLAASQ